AVRRGALRRTGRIHCGLSAADGAGPRGPRLMVSTSVSPDGRRVWRAARAPVFIAAVILLAAIALVLTRGQSAHGDLDPGSATPGGSQALARLLTGQGVRVV